MPVTGETANCVYIYVSMCVYLPKVERKVKLSYFFSPLVIFILFLFQRELLCLGRGQGVFSSLFMQFFSLSLFVSFKGNYSPGPFQLSNATKDNPASSLPCPHTCLFLQQKQPLLGMVIISQGSFFIPQVREHSSTLYQGDLLQMQRDSGCCSWCSALSDVVHQYLPAWQLRCSEHSLFLQAGFLTYYKNWLSIYLLCTTWN